MKEEDWGKVRVGQTLILADRTLGVLRCTVKEIDVAVELEDPTYRKAYPWGLTATSGTVRVMCDGVERIWNLRTLVAYKGGVFSSLRKAWDDYQKYSDYASAYLEVFQSLATQEQAR